MQKKTRNKGSKRNGPGSKAGRRNVGVCSRTIPREDGLVGIAIDVESTGLGLYRGCEPFMVTACDENGKTFIWEFPVDPFTRKVQYDETTTRKIRKTLGAYKKWVFHNANYDLRALLSIGFLPGDYWDKEIHDTQYMSHAFESTARHGLKVLALVHLDYSDIDEKELENAVKAAQRKARKLGWSVAGGKSNIPSLKGEKKEVFRSDYWLPKALDPTDKTCEKYALGDVERTIGLFIFFKQVFEDDQWQAYNRLRPLVKSVFNMQTNGVSVIPRNIKMGLQHFEEMRESLHQWLVKYAKKKGLPDFNPASTEKVQTLLFDKMKLEPVAFTKTGFSTDADTLEVLLENTFDKPEQHDVIQRLIDFRKTKKTIEALNSYGEVRFNNRLYPSFFAFGTVTGRFSCKNPNTQNVGKKKQEYDEENDSKFSLRNIFGPLPGKVWYAIDYDQFQLRIFAYASNTPELVRAFDNGLDVHNIVACDIFGIDTPDELQRRAAKAVNFGIIFGAGPKRIAAESGIPDLYYQYTERYHNVPVYIAKYGDLAKKQGYVHTLGGYRVSVPWKFKYKAANYVVQGTEAEIVKRAMIDIDNFLEYDAEPRLKMIMQVHDELIFEGNAGDDHTEVLHKVADMMLNSSLEVGVKAAVECSRIDNNWAEKVKLFKK